MSWLLDRPADRAEILGLRPELAAAHARLVDALWDGPMPAETLELCRLRMAQLLAAGVALVERSPQATLSPDRVAALPRWANDGAFTDDEKACLAFTELFVVAHHDITDEQAAAVRHAHGEAGLVALTTALSVWENQHRFDIALGGS